jgi:serine protease Do
MKTINVRLLVATIFSSLFLGHAYAQSELAKVKQSEEKPVIQFQQGAAGRIVSLTKIKTTTTTPPARIGELRHGWGCNQKLGVAWDKAVSAQYTQRLAKVFRDELEKAKYPVAQQKDAIFDDESAADKQKSTPQLHVGALIKEVSVNYCSKDAAISTNPVGGLRARISSLYGGVYVKVFWQAYLPEGKKVIFETTTEGTYQVDDEIKSIPSIFFEKAFAMAARNLLAEKAFHAAVLSKEMDVTLADSSSQKVAIKMRRAKATNASLKSNITNLRMAVATIILDDKRTGTGFFVSQDGYWLTNQHVVGASRFVKVKLPTGRELIGEVIRSDSVRDVALIKTEPVSLAPISLGTDEPNIGEEVYVLGSPLGDTFNSTLTRGILSGYRTLKDKRFLQSDVAILPGNSGGPLLDAKGRVIGITVAGLGARGLAGMNFFIPIKDAISSLNIEFTR